MAEEDVDHSDHEDHDHQDHDHDVPEELRAEGAKLLVDAVGQVSPDDMERILRSLPTPLSTEVVQNLIGNKLDPKRLKNVGSLLVGTLRKRPAARLSPIVERLSTMVLATFEKELGEERFENPSVDDLREVIDAVLAEHPATDVRYTLAWVVADGLPAAEAARDVLLTDDRLRLPDWAEVS
ncbi:MAG: hypothetical protein LC792_06075 [Actinobacteria bacterium]|nr:hypothetical protein [Actinomycetota bacterium]